MQTGIDVMCQMRLCAYVWADRSVRAQCIHLLGALCLSEENWHWWEQTGWRRRLSSQRPHHYGWNPFDHPSFSPSPSVGLSVDVSAGSFPAPKSRWAVAVMAHDRHTFLSFEFFPFHWRATPHHTTPPPPLPYTPTHMHACSPPHTTSLSPAFNPSLFTELAMKELLVHQAVGHCSGNEIRLKLVTFRRTCLQSTQKIHTNFP